MKILIINGPNLNLLGSREPEIYGHDTLEQIQKEIRAEFSSYELSIDFFQSNIEGEIVGKIQEAKDGYEGVVINPAAYSHTSVAIFDALSILDIPVIEVHLTNIHKREEFRQKMITSKAATAIIAGLGKEGYSFALKYIIKGKN